MVLCSSRNLEQPGIGLGIVYCIPCPTDLLRFPYPALVRWDLAHYLVTTAGGSEFKFPELLLFRLTFLSLDHRAANSALTPGGITRRRIRSYGVFAWQLPPLSPLSSNTSESSVTESTPRSTCAELSSNSEVENILQVLETGNLTQGPVTRSRACAIQLQEQLNQSDTFSSSAPNLTNTNSHSMPQAPNPSSSVPQSAPKVPSSANQPGQLAQHVPAALTTQPVSAAHPAPHRRRRRMVFADLPAQHERAAPSFDEKHLEEIEQYFLDLDALFDDHTIQVDDKKKRAAVRYIKNVGTEKLWRLNPAYADTTQTYTNFKTNKLWMYPGALDDCAYTPQDLDTLIGERIHIGIVNPHELGEYYCQFLLITQYLVSKNWMVALEQLHAFFGGFCPDFANRISQQLQLKQPNHLLIDPYDLDDIYEAATFFLMGTGYMQTSTTQPTTHFVTLTRSRPVTTPLQPDATTIKIEALTMAMATFREMFESAMDKSRGKPRNTAPRPAGASGSTCNFCRGAGHFIRECEVVAKYNRTSKCKRNHEGKVVLPLGVMVLRDVPGNWLHNRMDEWHWKNLGQMASQMLLEVAVAKAVSALSSEVAGQSYMSYPAQATGQGPEELQLGLYALR